VKKHKRLK